MEAWGMMLGVVISPIVWAFVPVASELALELSASQPFHPQLPALRLLGNDGGVCVPYRCGIVPLQWGWWLFPPHLLESVPQGHHLLICQEESQGFSLSC